MLNVIKHITAKIDYRVFGILKLAKSVTRCSLEHVD